MLKLKIPSPGITSRVKSQDSGASLCVCIWCAVISGTSAAATSPASATGPTTDINPQDPKRKFYHMSNS